MTKRQLNTLIENSIICIMKNGSKDVRQSASFDSLVHVLNDEKYTPHTLKYVRSNLATIVYHIECDGGKEPSELRGYIDRLTREVCDD